MHFKDPSLIHLILCLKDISNKSRGPELYFSLKFVKMHPNKADADVVEVKWGWGGVGFHYMESRISR